MLNLAPAVKGGERRSDQHTRSIPQDNLALAAELVVDDGKGLELLAMLPFEGSAHPRSFNVVSKGEGGGLQARVQGATRGHNLDTTPSVASSAAAT